MSRFRFGDPSLNDPGRWRHRWLISLSDRPHPRGVTWQDRAGRQFQAQIAELQSFCTGRASRTRLARLISSLSSPYRGESESAHAELDLAIRLIRAGFELNFFQNPGPGPRIWNVCTRGSGYSLKLPRWSDHRGAACRTPQNICGR